MAMNSPTIQSYIPRSKDYGNPGIQALMLLIVLVLVSWFLIKPKLTESAQNRAELKAAESQLSGIQQDRKDLNRLVNELRSAPDELLKVDEALPLNGRITKMYVLLESFVRSSGMTLTLVSAGDTSRTISAGDKELLENPYQPGRELHTMTLTTSVTGSMDQFKNFLELIETNGRVLDVETVEVVGGDPLTKFRITVNAYAYEKVDNLVNP
jgi:Tfp pilus assembly protein PilO